MVRFAALFAILMLSACGHAGPVSPIAEMFASFGSVEPERQPPSTPLVEVPEEPRSGIEGCGDVLAAQAKSHGAIHVEAGTVGQPTRMRRGITEVQVDATVFYQKDDWVQYREARITCQLDRQGKVVGLQ